MELSAYDTIVIVIIVIVVVLDYVVGAIDGGPQRRNIINRFGKETFVFI